MSLIPNSFQTPNTYVDRLMPLLTDPELRALIYMARQIYGFRQPHGQISSRQLANGKTAHGRQVDNGAGLSVGAAQKAIASLVAYGIAIQTDAGGQRTAPTYDLQLDEKRIDWAGLEARAREKKSSNRKRTRSARRSVPQIASSDLSHRSQCDQSDRSPSDQSDRSNETQETQQEEEGSNTWIPRRIYTPKNPPPQPEPEPRDRALAALGRLIDQPKGLLKKRREETGQAPGPEDWAAIQAWADHYMGKIERREMDRGKAAALLYTAIRNAEDPPAGAGALAQEPGPANDWAQILEAAG